MTITARIPPRVEQALAAYCVEQGVTKSEVIVKLLESFLFKQTGEAAKAYALAAKAGFIGCIDGSPAPNWPVASLKNRVKDAIRAKHTR